MNVKNTSHKTSYAINYKQLNETDLQMVNSFSLPRWPVIVVALSLGIVTQPAMAENAGIVDIQHYMKSQNEESTEAKAIQNTKNPLPGKDAVSKNTNPGDQSPPGDQKIEPVSKPADGKGKLPAFAQADVNGDHYITKDELQNFPYLLQVFDKVDAGKDGKLEQHEFENLEMETKREGEVR